MGNYDNLMRLKELLERRAEGRLEAPAVRHYEQVRRELLDDNALAACLPKWVRESRGIDDAWPHLRAFSTYQERRDFVRTQLEAAFAFVEQPRPPRLPEFAPDTDAFFSKVAQLLMTENSDREVAMLTGGPLAIVPSDTEVYNGVPWDITVGLPLDSFTALSAAERNESCRRITTAAQVVADPDRTEDFICGTEIFVEVRPLPDWQTHALTYLRREGITNQARVRSASLPSRERDGLLFRSEPEELTYVALRRAGVLFAPLPVFLRGGNTYQRLEPDFIVFEGGRTMLIELDGDHFHRESPVEAHERTQAFNVEGAFIQRVKADACDTEEKARQSVRRLLDEFRRWRTTG